ncbi:MAG TPA: hypothetical protein VF438_03820, partial [Candidatus Paceibacterota bacterium]
TERAEQARPFPRFKKCSTGERMKVSHGNSLNLDKRYKSHQMSGGFYFVNLTKGLSSPLRGIGLF